MDALFDLIANSANIIGIVALVIFGGLFFMKKKNNKDDK